MVVGIVIAGSVANDLSTRLLLVLGMYEYSLRSARARV